MFRQLFIFTSLLFTAAAQEAVQLLEHSAALLKEGKRNEAISLLDKVRNDGSLRAIEKFQLGWLYGQAQRYEVAIAIFESLPQDVPGVSTHAYARALSYFNMGRFQKTIDILADVKRQGLEDTRALNLLGVAYAKAGEAEKAYNSLRDGVTDGPVDLISYLNLVTLCVDYQNLALAEKIATQGVVAFPGAGTLYVSRGAVRMLRGQKEEAREDFSTAANLKPIDSNAYFFLALADYKLGRFAEAIETLNKAIARGVADPDLHYLLAESLIRSEPAAPAAVIPALNRAIALDPLFTEALVLRAKLHLQSGAVEQSVADLESARKVEPGSRTVLYNLAKAYRQSGRERQARELFQKVQDDTVAQVDTLAGKKIQKVLVERSGKE